MRVLVVEDEPAIRHLIDRLLTRRGHHVLTAPNALLAAAILIDYGVTLDIALIDLSLPGGTSGIAFADRLGVQFPALRVIFMTGHLEPEKLAEAARRGPLLLKPFTSDQLLTIMAAAS